MTFLKESLASSNQPIRGKVGATILGPPNIEESVLAKIPLRKTLIVGP